MKQLLRNLRNFVHTLIYRSTRRWRKGLEPLDPEELMRDAQEPFWATPTFRYFKPWPWDRERPRWLPAYPTPDYTPSAKNILPYPERRALNKDGPQEGYPGGRADEFRVLEWRRGARVYCSRFSRHGRQHSSDVWCKVELPWRFLRTGLQNDLWGVDFHANRSGAYFSAWVPAIWLADSTVCVD